MLVIDGHRFRKVKKKLVGRSNAAGTDTWLCIKSDTGCKAYAVTLNGQLLATGFCHVHNVKKRKSRCKRVVKKETVKCLMKKRAKKLKTYPYSVNGTKAVDEYDSLSSELSRIVKYFSEK